MDVLAESPAGLKLDPMTIQSGIGRASDRKASPLSQAPGKRHRKQSSKSESYFSGDKGRDGRAADLRIDLGSL